MAIKKAPASKNKSVVAALMKRGMSKATATRVSKSFARHKKTKRGKK